MSNERLEAKVDFILQILGYEVQSNLKPYTGNFEVVDFETEYELVQLNSRRKDD